MQLGPLQYGLVGNGEPTYNDLARLRKELRRIAAAPKQTAYYKFLLPDGGYAHITCTTRATSVTIFKNAVQVDEPETVRSMAYRLPMPYSGVLRTTMWESSSKSVDITVTEQTRKRLAEYGDELGPKDISTSKFAVETASELNELAPDVGAFSQTVYSQYHHVWPTWWSGAMAGLVQFVSGYGSLMEEHETPDYLTVPDEVVEAACVELGIEPPADGELASPRLDLPGFLGAPNPDGIIRLDYKPTRTHGVAFARDGKPWLVTIDSDGLFVMPLPVIVITTTAAFRAWVEANQDEELLFVLDKFGGLPTGEIMPVAYRNQWVAAGAIIKLADGSAYDGYSPFGTGVGWAFNASGISAVNVLTTYDSQGYSVSTAFEATFNIGDLDTLFAKAAGESTAPTNVALLKAVQEADDARPLFYKMSRMTTDELEGMDVTTLRDTVLPPIATATGGFHVLRTGRVYSAMQWPDGPQIKVQQTLGAMVTVPTVPPRVYDPLSEFNFHLTPPDPLNKPAWETGGTTTVAAQQGCISADLTPIDRYAVKGVNVDTWVYAYFDGDDLCTCSEYMNWKKWERATSGEHPGDNDCGIIGSWTYVETSTPTSVYGDVYASMLDPRRTGQEGSKVTTVTGTPGPWSVGSAAFDYFFAIHGTVHRVRWYKHTTNTKTIGGWGFASAACAPYGCREGLLVVLSETTNHTTTSSFATWHSVTDPNWYGMYTYNTLGHWAGGPQGPEYGAHPENGRPVVVNSYHLSLTDCNDYANAGEWLDLGQDIGQTTIPISLWITTGSNTSSPPKDTNSPPSPNTPVTNTSTGAKTIGELHFFGREIKQKLHDAPDKMYFLGSPDPYVGIFMRRAYRNSLGSTVYEVVEEQNGRFGASTLLDEDGTWPVFIGVINE